HGDADPSRDRHADAAADAPRDRDADRHGHADRHGDGHHDARHRGSDALMATDQLFADRYRLERRLGVGGMATVQLAFDTRVGGYVAPKLRAAPPAAGASFLSRVPP